MKKTFCGICDAPAMSSKKLEYTLDTTLTCDDTAKARIGVYTNLVNHSRGFGGSPDLCYECMLNLIEELKNICIEEINKIK